MRQGKENVHCCRGNPPHRTFGGRGQVAAAKLQTPRRETRSQPCGTHLSRTARATVDSGEGRWRGNTCEPHHIQRLCAHNNLPDSLLVAVRQARNPKATRGVPRALPCASSRAHRSAALDEGRASRATCARRASGCLWCVLVHPRVSASCAPLKLSSRAQATRALAMAIRCGEP